MSDSTYLISITGSRAMPVGINSPLAINILEEEIERWIIDNPGSLGDSVMIVASQYRTWGSESGESAAERLDILGLDKSGVPIVVELKRNQDRTVHLQAITYAALVSSFTKQTMAEAHAKFLNDRSPGANITVEEALQTLEEHVTDGWDDEAILGVPRIILVAPEFPPQVYTTVTWLTEVSSASGREGLSIELRKVSAFRSTPTAEETFLLFQRIYPEEKLDDRRLVAGAITSRIAKASDAIATSKRNSWSTHIIHDHGLIAAGEALTLNLSTIVRPETIEKVQEWIRRDPRRGLATWTDNRGSPLRWSADESETWAPTKLVKHIINESAGEMMSTISGTDVWLYKGESLYKLANRTVSQD